MTSIINLPATFALLYLTNMYSLYIEGKLHSVHASKQEAVKAAFKVYSLEN